MHQNSAPYVSKVRPFPDWTLSLSEVSLIGFCSGSDKEHQNSLTASGKAAAIQVQKIMYI